MISGVNVPYVSLYSNIFFVKNKRKINFNAKKKKLIKVKIVRLKPQSFRTENRKKNK